RDWADWKAKNQEKAKSFPYEFVSFQINWNKPLEEIEAMTLAWLRRNARKETPRTRRGRHATPWAAPKDALRQLGALRLLAHYPLIKAIKITQECGVKLYSCEVDDEGRPAHRTAWENGIKRVPGRLRTMFGLNRTQMPLSWLKREQRRACRRKQK